MKKLSVFVLALLLLAGCANPAASGGSSTAAGPETTGAGSAIAASVAALENPPVIAQKDLAPREALAGCPLYVEAVEDLPEDFIFGMDASQVPALEASGVKYYDRDGTERDVFEILAANGVNYIRVRVWNDPFDAQGHGYGGGNCNVDTALEIGKRATACGMKLLVDFHYSDFWADPGKQMVPKAWKDYDLETKAAALEAYTHDVLMTLRNGGVDVGMVQVGNETNGALCGEKDWSDIVKLMAAGSRAVRDVFPQAKVAVHFANPERGNYLNYASTLKIFELDYDVFGSSYYPYWHGSLNNLTQTLEKIRKSYGKDVMVLETSYAWTAEDFDFSGNTISESSEKPYPYTQQGQVNSLRDVTQAVQKAGGIGVCYWEGTWIGVGGVSKEENQKLWEQYGSGWASSYAAEYDPEDAGKWYGGCAVDNQSFFDPQGRALDSLMAFNLIRFGNSEVALKAEEVEPAVLKITVGDPVVLPETVNVVMTDNSRQSVPVTWQADPAAMTEPGFYEIEGTASVSETEQMSAKLELTIEGVNLLQNPSFEESTEAPWVVTDLGSCKELKLEKKAGDSRTGEGHYHFWSPDSDSVCFTLEQTPEGLESGSYDFRIWIMGGDCGEAEVYAYAKLDGETVATAPMEITSWNEWHPGEISGIAYTAGQTLTLGIYVRTPAGGAWGKIDDASLSIR
ncbi:MAG: glycosyl hydrolase 53 family protein [Oscillospiraceae bacterium]|nr:glycosyl hydrolase 53 family protein [Oscillospiraceae bacterium]